MKNLILFVVLIYTSHAFASVHVETIQNNLIYKFQVEGLKKIKTDNGLRFELQGVGSYQAIHYEVGSPELPVIRMNVMADSEKDITIAVDKSQIKSQEVDGFIMPSQESLVKIPNSKRVNAFNKALYYDNRLYPNKNYAVEYIGSVRGKNEFQVTLYPVNYNPVAQSIVVNKHFVVTVNKPLIVNEDKEKTFLFLTGKKFENSRSLAEYIAFKESLGYKVINSIITPDMKAAQIRKIVQSVYKKPGVDLEATLIIGRDEDVDAFPSKTLNGGVTDHYYRSIDTNNYDTDINAPDQLVGRLTIKTEAELATVIGKLIKYQKGIFTDNKWQNKAAFLATNDQYELAEGTHNYVIDNFTKQRAYTGIFPEAETLGGDKLYAITYRADKDDVVEAFNLGRAIINYSGHGATTYWDAPRFSQRDVLNIKDSDAYPFVISNACITGKFTVAESFGETWLKAKNGAIMFYGSMENTYWDEDDILERRMFDGIFLQQKETFGAITEYGMKELWKHYGGAGRSKYYWETYVVFGDASIKLRRK